MKRVFAWFAAALVVAIAIDRGVLYVWSVQVIAYYRSVQSSLQVADQPLPNDPTALAVRARHPLRASAFTSRWPVRLLDLNTDGFLLRAHAVLVDGSGGVHVTFYPPLLAWSTRLWPPNPSPQYFESSVYKPQMYYQYQVSVLQDGTAPLTTQLSQGLRHNPAPLREDEIRPLLWP